MPESATEKLGKEPRYSVHHSAELIRVYPNTLRAWFTGIKFANRGPQEPILKLDNPTIEPITLSFFNLVEAGFLAAYRSKKVSMQRIRLALRFAEESGYNRPLLSADFKVIGKNLLLKHYDDLFEASKTPGQKVWPEMVEEYFASIDFDKFGPTQYWLLGKHRPCVAMPRIAFGEPVIPRCGVRIEVIHSRFHAGEGVDDISSDLSLTKDEVEEAVRCGDMILKTAA